MLSFRCKNISESCRLLLILIVMVACVGEVKGQKVYATSTTLGPTTGSGGSATYTGNAAALIDENTIPVGGPAKISIKGNAGLPGGTFTGWLALQFNQNVPANKTVFIKVNGINSDFKAEAYTGTATSPTSGSKSSTFTALDGSVYYAVTATASFNKVRLTGTATGGVLGSVTNTIDVNYAFYESSSCGSGTFTSYSGGGLLGGTVATPLQAIDGNTGTSSVLTPAAALSSVEQTVYFNGPSLTNDEVKLTLSAPPNPALDVALLANITVTAYNGNTSVWSTDLNTVLNLNLALLGLLKAGTPITLSVTPNQAFDRVSISFSSVLNLFTTLNIHEVQRTPPKATFSSTTAQNVTICSGTKASLTAQSVTTDYQLRWYETETGGSVLSNASSYETVVLTANKTYYVAVANAGCANVESIRVPVIVTINSISGGTVTADQTLCSNSLPAAFTSTATATTMAGGTAATYQWQKSSDNVNFTNIPSATSLTYTETAALTATTYYRRVATSSLNSISCSGNSNVITVAVNLITAGTIGSSQVICFGLIPTGFTSSAAATITPGGTAASYQWQKSTDNVNFNNIAGATNLTYTETIGPTQNTYYRRMASSTLNSVTCSANTTSILITIHPVPIVPPITIH